MATDPSRDVPILVPITPERAMLEFCPFCGGAGFLERDVTDQGSWVARCDDCAATSAWCATKEEATEKWNTRSEVRVEIKNLDIKE